MVVCLAFKEAQWLGCWTLNCEFGASIPTQPGRCVVFLGKTLYSDFFSPPRSRNVYLILLRIGEGKGREGEEIGTTLITLSLRKVRCRDVYTHLRGTTFIFFVLVLSIVNTNLIQTLAKYEGIIWHAFIITKYIQVSILMQINLKLWTCFLCLTLHVCTFFIALAHSHRPTPVELHIYSFITNIFVLITIWNAMLMCL